MPPAPRPSYDELLALVATLQAEVVALREEYARLREELARKGDPPAWAKPKPPKPATPPRAQAPEPGLRARLRGRADGDQRARLRQLSRPQAAPHRRLGVLLP